MKKLFLKLIRWFVPIYQVVYQTKDGRTEMYTITPPKHQNEFGNKQEGREIVGFRSFCFNRGGIRSFRYNQIISLNKV